MKSAGSTGSVACAVVRPAVRAPLPPYLIVSAAGVLSAALVAYRAPWAGDFGLHAATVERLREDLWRPADPMVRAHTGHPYNTPYTVLLGLVSLVTGRSGTDTLRLAAPVCFGLLLYGLCRFVRIFSADRWAPVAALPLVLALWGEGAPAWSGFLNLAGLPLILAYPSTVALAAALCWWAYLWRCLDRPSPGRWAVAGALLGGLAVVHPFTAVEAAAGAAALMLRRRPGLPALTGVAAAAAVVLAWPYTSMLDVLLAAGDLDGIHRPLYSGVLRVYGPPLLLCLPALAVRLRRDPLDPLAAMTGVTLALAGAGWVTGHWALGRMWPVVMIAAPVALAVELLAALRAGFRGGFRSGLGGGTAGPVRAVLAGAWALVTVAGAGWGGYLQRDHTLAAVGAGGPVMSFTQRHAWITGRVAAGDVLLLDLDDERQRWTARDLIGSGVQFVAPPWPHPSLPDAALRHADNRELLADGTPGQRRLALLRRYDVRWVLDVTGTRGWLDAAAIEVVAGPAPSRLVRVA